ncbi:LamG-like jellyroll fold domain-containing protein [Planctomycetota bacterium]
MNSVADTAGFIAVYPNAVPPRFTFNDVGFISALIDTLESHYDIDLARVYSCGYSNGGMMTYRLLCQLGHRFAAGACVAGTLTDQIVSGSNRIRPFPLLHIHGTADNLVPYNGDDYKWSVEETLNFWLENNTCLSEPHTLYLPDIDTKDNSTIEKISYLNCDDETNIILYKVINGGHHWPGGETWWKGGGNLNMDINASVEIWNFFKNYKLVTRPIVDFNGDGKVDVEDLIILIEHWGTDEPLCDIAPQPFGDGVVDALDLEILMSYWGQEIDDLTLIAHWALDEAEGSVAYDSAATNDAALVGNALWQPEGGILNGALQFDGIDNYLNTPHVINPGTADALSVFVWVKGGAPGQVIVSQLDGTNWLLADPAHGYLMTDIRAESGRNLKALVSETLITDGDWHRVGLVWDGTHRFLYADDRVVAADTGAIGLPSVQGGLNIGCDKNNTPSTFWLGMMDDVRIYDRAVTP